MTEIRVDEGGLLATDPIDFPAAVARVRDEGLAGLWIRPDSLAGRPGAPTIDLALLDDLPTLRDFGIAEGVGEARLLHFEAVYSLRALTKLAIYTFVGKLDLARFERLEILMIADDPAIIGIDSLTTLRRVQIAGLRRADIGLAANTALRELILIRAKPDALVGLDRLAELRELQLSHCAKLRSIVPLPPRLQQLRILKCSKLASLDCLRGNTTIESLYASTLADVAFVPSMTALVRLGFEKLGDGQLGPLLESPTLREINFPSKKSYSHDAATLRAAFAVRDEGY